MVILAHLVFPEVSQWLYDSHGAKLGLQMLQELARHSLGMDLLYNLLERAWTLFSVDVHQDVHLSKKFGDSFLVQNSVDFVIESLGLLGNLICTQRLEVDTDLEALRVLWLDVGGGAETLELASDHDTYLGAQGFCLFHTVGR